MSEGKPSTGLVIGLLIGVVVLCGGGVVMLGALYFVGPTQRTTTIIGMGGPISIDATSGTVTYPFTDVLEQFRSAVADGDAEAAYALLSDEYVRDVSLADFRKEAEAHPQADDADWASPGGEHTHVDRPDAPDSGSWKHSIWTDDGMATERIDFIEQSPGVWRVERWVVE